MKYAFKAVISIQVQIMCQEKYIKKKNLIGMKLWLEMSLLKMESLNDPNTAPFGQQRIIVVSECLVRTYLCAPHASYLDVLKISQLRKISTPDTSFCTQDIVPARCIQIKQFIENIPQYSRQYFYQVISDQLVQSQHLRSRYSSSRKIQMNKLSRNIPMPSR